MENAKHLQELLEGIGLSRPFAYQLSTGQRLPSLRMAARIERKLGIPAASWVKEP